jgi:hypothetical protein
LIAGLIQSWSTGVLFPVSVSISLLAVTLAVTRIDPAAFESKCITVMLISRHVQIVEWSTSSGRDPPGKTLPSEFRMCCLFVLIVSIVGSDPFHSFDPVVKNKLQFKGPNLIQKLDDCLKKLADITEHTTCKRCFDMAEKPEVGWCQIRTVY